MKFSFDPGCQPLFISVAHLRERQSCFALLRCPDDLSFAVQLFLIARQAKLELYALPRRQRSGAFQSNAGLADIAGLRKKSPVGCVDQSRFYTKRMTKVPHAFFQHDPVRRS